MDKATGITRPIAGQEEWVELWVGDVIKCRVYITDRAGCYLWIDEAEVFWEKDYGQYSIKAKYHSHGKDVTGIFALREVLRRKIEFITKVERVNGHCGDIILELARTLGKWKRSAYNGATEQTLDKVIDKMIAMNIIPEEIIMEAFNRE